MAEETRTTPITGHEQKMVKENKKNPCLAVKRGGGVRRNCNVFNLWNCMHFFVIMSLKTLWSGVKHWRTALHRFYLYRRPIDHLHDLVIWKWFKNMYISIDLKCICVKKCMQFHVSSPKQTKCNTYVHARKWHHPCTL
jgi:hypothetical protein